jgi:hypothetical protein
VTGAANVQESVVRYSPSAGQDDDGACVDDFLEWFAGLAREQVKLVLRHAARCLAAV